MFTWFSCSSYVSFDHLEGKLAQWAFHWQSKIGPTGTEAQLVRPAALPPAARTQSKFQPAEVRERRKEKKRRDERKRREEQRRERGEEMRRHCHVFSSPQQARNPDHPIPAANRYAPFDFLCCASISKCAPSEIDPNLLVSIGFQSRS